MTKNEFLEWASSQNIPQGAFALDGGHPSETLVLDKRGTAWCVYYSERGLETDSRTFASEAEAYSYLAMRLEQIIPK